MGSEREDAERALDGARMEKDVNATIKHLLSEMEIAARTPPVEACHPYEADRRRKLVIRAIWTLYKRVRPDANDAG